MENKEETMSRPRGAIKRRPVSLNARVVGYRESDWKTRNLLKKLEDQMDEVLTEDSAAESIRDALSQVYPEFEGISLELLRRRLLILIRRI